jgi:hypothetical protein
MAPSARILPGIPSLGCLRDSTCLLQYAAVTAIVDNYRRQRVASGVAGEPESIAAANHQAVIAPDVPTDPNDIVCDGVVIDAGSKMKQHVALNTGCTVNPLSQIADSAHFGPRYRWGGDVHMNAGDACG